MPSRPPTTKRTPPQRRSVAALLVADHAAGRTAPSIAGKSFNTRAIGDHRRDRKLRNVRRFTPSTAMRNFNEDKKAGTRLKRNIQNPNFHFHFSNFQLLPQRFFRFLHRLIRLDQSPHMRHINQSFHLRIHPGHSQFPLPALRRHISAHQRPQPRRIHIRHSAEIQNQLSARFPRAWRSEN